MNDFSAYTKFYYPYCRQTNCDGLLEIKLDSINFNINSQCDKNLNHKKKIYFETFKRFYLHEKNIVKCCQCNQILDNIFNYKCKYCKNFYCQSCFIYDAHLENDFNNISFIYNNYCHFHKDQLIFARIVKCIYACIVLKKMTMIIITKIII